MLKRRMIMGTLIMTLFHRGLNAEILQAIGSDAKTGASQAVVVRHTGLVHTAQLFPRDERGQILRQQNASRQAELVCDQLATAVTAAGGGESQIAKLNVYLSELAAKSAVETVLAERFPQNHKPAVSYVVTSLPFDGCHVAMDAVAVASAATQNRVTIPPAGSHGPVASLTPPGSMIYIAGQAAKGDSLAQATRATLESLHATLQFLGRDLSDVVQVKSFLTPMSQSAEAQRELTTFFGTHPVPPAVWVEWTMPLIEIELIVWGGEKKGLSPVEYITPPGMTASPVYSRVARTNSDRLLYVSGLYARGKTDGAGEVNDIFQQLQSIVEQGGSSLKHLVKATYYCSNNETSSKLNELRPNYYDPTRPPSASKALVRGVGHADRGLSIDMIAIPRE